MLELKKTSLEEGDLFLHLQKKLAVNIITHPIINDLDAAAPTKPSTISKEDNGAARIS